MFQSANKQYRIPKLQQDPLWFTLPKPGHSSSFSVWFPHPSSWRRCSFFIVIIETSTATVPRCFRVFFHDMWNPPPKKHIYYWRIHRRNVPLTLSGVFRRRLFSLIWRLQNGVKARTMSILNTTGSAYASNGNPETKPFWRNQTKKRVCWDDAKSRKEMHHDYDSIWHVIITKMSNRFLTRFPSLVYLLGNAVLFSYNNLWFSFIIFIHQKDPTTKKHQRKCSKNDMLLKKFSPPHLSAEWTFTQPQVAGKGLFFRAFSAVGRVARHLDGFWCFGGFEDLMFSNAKFSTGRPTSKLA